MGEISWITKLYSEFCVFLSENVVKIYQTFRVGWENGRNDVIQKYEIR